MLVFGRNQGGQALTSRREHMNFFHDEAVAVQYDIVLI